MSVNTDIQVLRSEIAKGREVMDRLARYLHVYQAEKITGKTPSIAEAMVVSQSLSNYYTCIETIFVRISRFFENHLPPDRWHQALLEKMCLEIEGIRPRVISDFVFSSLLELLKFRHFSRYYFDLDYDWDKLLFLIKKFNDLREPLKKDMEKFDVFLVRLLKASND